MDKKTVLFITGCSSGFGKELVLESLKRGYRVVATARKNSDLNYLANNKKALCLEVDVTKPETIETAAKKAGEHFGRIDILINNAGIRYIAEIDNFDEVKMRQIVETNMFGAIYTARALLPYLKKQKGILVNMASLTSFFPFYDSIFYGITKSAMDSIIMAFRQHNDSTGNGIQAMSVNPGVFQTSLRAKALEDNKKGYSGTEPNANIVAKEILNCLEHNKELPFRLILGKDSLERYKQVMVQMKKDLRLAKIISINKKKKSQELKRFWKHVRIMKV